MPVWTKHAVPTDLTEEAQERVRAALAKRRQLLSKRLTETQHIRADCVPNPFGMGGKSFWVTWFGRIRDDWPPEENEYVFSKAEHEGARLMSWVFPTAELAADLIREIWDVSCPIPDDLRSIPS